MCQQQGRLFNSAMLWSGDGMLLARSDKHHLVPFGEYLPFQSFLETIGLQQLARLRGGYAAGSDGARLSAARLPRLAPLICYEAVFPRLARRGARPAAFVNLTNDGWFGTGFGPISIWRRRVCAPLSRACRFCVPPIPACPPLLTRAGVSLTAWLWLKRACFPCLAARSAADLLCPLW